MTDHPATPLNGSERPCQSDHSNSAEPHFSNCTHCGFCLAVCPTYQLTGDENNSPRGRIRLWTDEHNGSLMPDEWTNHYTAECVGCLACETACPAGVPYGHLFEETRHAHVQQRRHEPGPLLRLTAALASKPNLMGLAALPLRVARWSGVPIHPLIPPGKPAAFETTASYAKRLVAIHQPKGPKVALLTGCLMESVFREINFATVRVLIAHGCHVEVPENQTCCGAFQDHTGIGDSGNLQTQNRTAFGTSAFDFVATNSSGCGYALAKALAPDTKVTDALNLLGQIGLQKRQSPRPKARLYVDLPCHLVHGQKVSIPPEVLDATGIPWEFAPRANDCCGSGGVYNLEKPENAQAILHSKSAFLNQAAGSPVILGTANHVCMMQWHSAGVLGLVRRPYQTRHIIQLLDAETPIDRT
jgi:glycolate oxidase iron-sulfur subunit